MRKAAQQKSDKNKNMTKKRKQVIVLVSVLAVLLIAGVITLVFIFNKGISASKDADELLDEYEQESTTENGEDEYSSAERNLDADAIDKYDVMAKLSIESLSLELPVISKMDDEALRVSVCYYKGAIIGEKGNMVITGHNFASGAHFGNLDRIKIGDIVSLFGPDNKEYRYRVYDTEVVNPDDIEALNEYEGEYALTLLTCVNNGNSRLLVRCTMSK